MLRQRFLSPSLGSSLSAELEMAARTKVPALMEESEDTEAHNAPTVTEQHVLGGRKS